MFPIEQPETVKERIISFIKPRAKPLYKAAPFPLERRLDLDAGWINKRQNTFSGIFEVDVTALRQALLAHKAKTGQSQSFTAYIVACLASTVDQDKSLHAYQNWRNQLIIFEDVDVAVMIEIDIGNRKFPLLHVVRAANKKSLLDIHHEIRWIQADPSQSPNFNSRTKRLMSLFLRLPGIARRVVYLTILKNPQWSKQVAGTVAVTSIGMFGKGGGWGLGLANHTLSLIIGGIAEKPGIVNGQIEIRDFLDLTVSFNHNIVDGAPAARFIQRFKEQIENGIN